MKKIMIMFVTACMIFPACSKQETQEKKMRVITSFYPVYIIAKNIASGVPGVELVSVTPQFSGCLHDYRLTSDDMKRLERAELFIVNGLGMESFLSLAASRYPALATAELAKGIEPIREKGEANPHVWLSITNTITMTNNCASAFAVADPQNADRYRANASAYISQLDALRMDMKKALDPYRGRKIITFHEAFPYFAKDYGFEIAAVIEREPGSEPSAKELAETIALVRVKKIKVLFAEPQYSRRSADVIARETGAVVYTLDPAVTGADDAGAYIAIMRKNLKVLLGAFR